MRFLRFLILSVFLFTCAEDREFLNPFDPLTPPDTWAPSSLTVSSAGANFVVLTWTQKNANIEGFVLTKVANGKSTEVTIPKLATSYRDEPVVPIGDPCSDVKYTLRAKAGSNLSNSIDRTTPQKFPQLSKPLAGTDLNVNQLTIQLGATSPADGEQGVWSIVSGSGGSFENTNLAVSNFTGVGYVPYTLKWTITGACGSAEDEVLVNLRPLPTVVTGEMTNVTGTSASTQITVSADGGSPVLERGLVFGTTQNPIITGNKIVTAGSLGSFNTTISGLTGGATYYVRGYATNAGGVAYGNQVSFLTPVPATVTTNSATNITDVSATTGGNVTSAGGGTITERGVCWSTAANPTISGNKTSNGSGTGAFNSDITGLTPGTLYYVRAYATNNAGTAYGTQISFTTKALPVVTTSAITSITISSANGGGTVNSDGGASITARGVCWSTSPAPTIANSKTSNGTGVGSFSSSLTGLAENTTYYVRAYATNAIGTSYGSEISFNTNILPIISTTVASAVGASSAVSGGSISASGATAVTARGVCWSTIQNPTTVNSKTVDGNGTGTFVSSITGLNPSTTYYARAYATNSGGTSYGNQISFATSPLSLASISTTAASNITASGAITGGTITDDGGSFVTNRGVCWSNSPNPTLLNAYTNDGSGTGAFTSIITPLSASTTYYVRAYAVNSLGTSYGTQISFTTPAISVPTITTTAISGITSSGANSGGTITGDGGAAVTARGVCWSTSPNPTTANSKTSNGTGTGIFTSSISGLLTGTKYYVRAYATNAQGTGYGQELSFTTSIIPTTYYQIGTGTLTNTTTTGAAITPFASSWTDSRHQYMIRAAELTGQGATAGPITGISFYIVNADPVILNGLTYKIGMTNQTTLDLSTSITGLTTVYSANTSLSGLSGWAGPNSINFNWDGVSNLVIEVCFDNTSSSSNTVIQYTSTAFNSNRYSYGSNSTGCSMTFSSPALQRPNILLKFN